MTGEHLTHLLSCLQLSLPLLFILLINELFLQSLSVHCQLLQEVLLCLNKFLLLFILKHFEFYLLKVCNLISHLVGFLVLMSLYKIFK